MGGTLDQPAMLAAALYAGMAAGLLYSFFRLLHRGFGGGRILEALLDGVFVLLAGALCIGVLFYWMKGPVRPYHLGALVLGFGLIRGILAPLFRAIFRKIFRKTVDNRGKKLSNKR